MTLQVKATFNLFGYVTPKVDLTPAIGVAPIALVTYLVAAGSF